MELKTIRLQGREYVQVAERLKYFRENYKEGRIETEISHLSDKVIFTAKVFYGDKLIATGHGMKNTAKEFELEKCETRAIGRALAIAGIGLDAGIASYEEIMDFKGYQNDCFHDVPQVDLTQSGKDTKWMTSQTRQVIMDLKKKYKITDEGFRDRVHTLYNTSFEGLTEIEALDLIKKITERFGS